MIREVDEAQNQISSGFTSALEYFCRRKTTLGLGWVGESLFLCGAYKNVLRRGLNEAGCIYYFFGRNCSTLGIFMVPLNSLRFLSQLSLNLLDLRRLSCYQWGSKLVLLGTGMPFASSQLSSLKLNSSLLRERVELKILLALISKRFFLLLRSALLRSWSAQSYTESFLREKVWLIMLEHSDMVSQLISMERDSIRSVKQEVNLGGMNLPFQRKNIFLYIFLRSSLNLPSSQSYPAQNLISRFLRAITRVQSRLLYFCYC